MKSLKRHILEANEWGILPEEITEAEHQGKKVSLNNPTRTPGGPKKFAVL